MSWRAEDHGETIHIRGRLVGRDHRGRPEYGPGHDIQHCIISPAGEQVVKGEGFVHGDITKYQVIAPAGTVVADGDVVIIRGEDFTVDQLQSFDYSPGRRPALRRHRPKVIFIVERGEVSESVS